jgi:hypothetical protein
LHLLNLIDVAFGELLYAPRRMSPVYEIHGNDAVGLHMGTQMLCELEIRADTSINCMNTEQRVARTASSKEEDIRLSGARLAGWERVWVQMLQ